MATGSDASPDPPMELPWGVPQFGHVHPVDPGRPWKREPQVEQVTNVHDAPHEVQV
ncbi:MAG TPA: hypothetical protein VI341_02680 [Actinomycetota bacterium]